MLFVLEKIKNHSSKSAKWELECTFRFDGKHKKKKKQELHFSASCRDKSNRFNLQEGKICTLDWQDQTRTEHKIIMMRNILQGSDRCWCTEVHMTHLLPKQNNYVEIRLACSSKTSPITRMQSNCDSEATSYSSNIPRLQLIFFLFFFFYEESIILVSHHQHHKHLMSLRVTKCINNNFFSPQTAGHV